MNWIRKNLTLAAQKAGELDGRRYLLGAVGLRKDGTMVCTRNILNAFPSYANHAESRLTRKLDVGSIVFVARVARDGGLVNARPCKLCYSNMFRRGVSKCYYTISQQEYGTIIF